MNHKTALLSLCAVAAMLSCSKSEDKPGFDNKWTFNGTDHIAKSVTAYIGSRRIGASDGAASTIKIQFFDKLPGVTTAYKVVDYAPQAPDQISIQVVTAAKGQYISRSNDSNVKAVVTVTTERMYVDLPKVWVVSLPYFKDSVQVSAALIETQRLSE